MGEVKKKGERKDPSGKKRAYRCHSGVGRGKKEPAGRGSRVHARGGLAPSGTEPAWRFTRKEEGCKNGRKKKEGRTGKKAISEGR